MVIEYYLVEWSIKALMWRAKELISEVVRDGDKIYFSKVCHHMSHGTYRCVAYLKRPDEAATDGF
jgi:hypothetical protein